MTEEFKLENKKYERNKTMENNQNQNQEIEIDLKQLFMVLWGNVWTIAIVGVICGMLAFGYFKFFATELYTSTTQIFVIDKQSDKITSSDISMFSMLSEDYLQLIQTRPVLERVIAELGLDMSTDDLSEKITASKQGESRIISISVEDESPIVAKRVADAIAKAAADQIYAVMDAELVNVVQPANVPEKPSSPATLRNTVIFAVIGVFVTCAIIVVRQLLDDTIMTADDVEKYLGITVIGNIPVFGTDDAPAKGKKKSKFAAPNTSIAKPVKTIVESEDLNETKRIDVLYDTVDGKEG